MAPISRKKKMFLWPSFHIFSHNGKTQNFYSFNTYLTYIRTHALFTLLAIFALPILRKLQIQHVWFLFGVAPGVNQ